MERASASSGAGLSWRWLAVLCAAYLLPGIIGHEPWKPDEGYVFGGVYHVIQTGDWVVPHVGGEPFMEKPPLFHLVAAFLAQLASPVLALHDGARLASALFVAIALLGVGAAARWTWGPGFGRRAVLLSLASLGLLVNAHAMLPDLPLMAGFSLALAGCAAGARRSPWAGLLIGTGAGVGFLAKGLIAPGVVGITVLALPLFFREWRHRAYVRLLVVAALSVLPWLLVWPTMLYLRSPDLFQTWFWDNNIGRFLGFSVPHLGARNERWLLWRTYPWFLFPGWAFALLALWRANKHAWRQPAVQIGLTFVMTMALMLGFSASARDIYLLPMILGLALVGSGSVSIVPVWLDRALTASGIAIVGAAIVLFWPVWATLIAQGHAPDWPWLTKMLPANFNMPFLPLAVIAALIMTAGAIATIVKISGRQGSGLIVWAASLTLTWGLATTLWLPWIDSARSYREVFESLAAALPREDLCISSRGLGESERAMLEYVIQVQTERQEVAGARSCLTLLVQSKVTVTPPTDQTWSLIWSGSRNGDSRESFQLYRLDLERQQEWGLTDQPGMKTPS